MTMESGRDRRDGYRLLSQAARMVQRRHDQMLAPLGLTRAAAIAMEGLAPGPLNQEQLAAAVHVKSQTLGRTLTRLERAGLVSRTRDRRDRRQFVIGLTSAGRAALTAVHHAYDHAFPSSLDARGWQTLREELARLVDSMQREGRAGLPSDVSVLPLNRHLRSALHAAPDHHAPVADLPPPSGRDQRPAQT